VLLLISTSFLDPSDVFGVIGSKTGRWDASTPRLWRQAEVLSGAGRGFVCSQRLFPPLVPCLAG